MKKIILIFSSIILLVGCQNDNNTKTDDAFTIPKVTMTIADPVSRVVGFFNDIVNKNYEIAFEKQNNKNWQPFDKFKSINGYGGITWVDIYEAKLIETKNNSAKVFLHYFAADPHNKDGIFKQYFILNKKDADWIITDSYIENGKRTILSRGDGEVNFSLLSNGNISVPVMINNSIKINFILDSGASEVNLSPDVFLTLIRTGTVDDSDYLGNEQYILADGSVVESRRIILKTLQIGEFILENIPVSVSNSIDSPMLLGQNVLNRFAKITIDNANNKLVITQNK